MPIYEQIVASIKEGILKGRISPTEKLPSIREMAAMLVTNPSTVAKAYSELERQGIIETLRGKGTYICEKFIPKLEEERMKVLGDSLKQVVLEAKYLNLTYEKLCNIINNIYGTLDGGNQDDRSEKSL